MKLNGLDLNKLNVFCAVIKHGGFKGASEELGLTRSAISQAISGFEGTLGQELFHRVGRTILPTPSAAKFYQEILQYQGNLQDSLQRLVGNDSRVEGTLRVGAYLEFTKSKLMPVIEIFLNQHPQAQLKLTFDSPSRLDRLLETDRIDLSISIFAHHGMKSIESRKLYQEELVLIGRKDLVNDRPKAEFLHEIPVIDYYPNHLLFKRWWVTHYAQRLGKITPRSYAATADMVFEMCKRRLGVGVVPRYLFENSSDRKDILVVQPTEKKLFDHMWLNERRQPKLLPIHKAFRKTLAEHFQI